MSELKAIRKVQNQLRPEAEPSPPDRGWAPRRGPQPLSSGEAIRRATHLRAKVAASPSDLLNPCDLETASRWEGRAFADLPDAIQSVGGELVPAEADHRHGGSMRNTVADPSYITLAQVDNIAQQDSAERAFNKLTRTFTTQVEALKRYRTGGEQRVTVQHVNVNEGGQAIVGNVSGGGGVPQKKVETTS